MATYCVSDIHGDYDKYRKLLRRISFSDRDTLYVLGDAVDRGPRPMDVLLDMMMRPNVIPIVGNHEYMALQCLRTLSEEITEEAVESFDETALRALMEWQGVGGEPTIKDFGRLSAEEREDVLDYLESFDLYAETEAGGRRFVLIHAGPEGFSPERPLTDYRLHELIFKVPDYGRVYYPDRYLVTGHRPTFTIPGAGMEPPEGRIYMANNHIAIDCGCGFGGPLGAVCLDTMEEFYAL